MPALKFKSFSSCLSAFVASFWCCLLLTPDSLLPFPHHLRDTLNVVRIREHVNGLEPVQPEAEEVKVLEVPRERRRIARDIDDLVRDKGEHAFSNLERGPGPRRVEHDHIGPHLPLDQGL